MTDFERKIIIRVQCIVKSTVTTIVSRNVEVYMYVSPPHTIRKYKSSGVVRKYSKLPRISYRVFSPTFNNVSLEKSTTDEHIA